MKLKPIKLLILLSLLPFAFRGRNQLQATPVAGVLFVDSGQNLGNGFSTDVALGDPGRRSMAG
jgi:hypothetical protein